MTWLHFDIYNIIDCNMKWRFKKDWDNTIIQFKQKVSIRLNIISDYKNYGMLGSNEQTNHNCFFVNNMSIICKLEHIHNMSEPHISQGPAINGFQTDQLI